MFSTSAIVDGAAVALMDRLYSEAPEPDATKRKKDPLARKVPVSLAAGLLKISTNCRLMGSTTRRSRSELWLEALREAVTCTRVGAVIKKPSKTSEPSSVIAPTTFSTPPGSRLART